MNQDHVLPSALINSIYEHDMKAFLHYHQHASSLAATDQDGKTLLQHAICANDLNIFNHVLYQSHESSAKEVVSILAHKDMAGWTPLHSAASIGSVTMFRAMLDKILLSSNQTFLFDWLMGKTRAGKTALHYACSKGHLDFVLAIVGAVTRGDLLVKFFLEQDLLGQTCIHRIAAIGRGDILHALFEFVDAHTKYALLSLKDKEGKQAKDVALEAGYPELAQTLIIDD